MSEIKDIVMPMLQKMQLDMATNFRRIDGKITNISENVAEMKDELDTIKGYITFSMGLTTQHQSAIADFRKEMADMKRRLAELESRS
ncbi:MAG: hypothetical protein ACRC7C_06325 [Beijerinckiaceae bacterium]